MNADPKVVPTRAQVLRLVEQDTAELSSVLGAADDLRERRENRIVWAASLPVKRDDGQPARPSRRQIAEAAQMSHGNVQHILRKRTPPEARIGSGRGARLFDTAAVKE